MAMFVYETYITEAVEGDERYSVNLYKETCPFCNIRCFVDDYECYNPDSNNYQNLAVCGRCGWWSHDRQDATNGYVQLQASAALLRKFATKSPEAPYVELSRHLARNPERLLHVDPAKFEELVGAVYSNMFGYKVETCSYGRPDRGIDVVCVRQDSGAVIAIQVKRYRHPIKLGYIHQFFGAMVESQYAKGVFVTTSKFQKGCYEVADTLDSIAGISIDLVDGRQFLDWLGIMNKRQNKVYCPLWGSFPITISGNSQEDPRWIDIPLEFR